MKETESGASPSELSGTPECLDHADCGAADIASEKGRAVHRFKPAAAPSVDELLDDEIPF